MPSESRRSTLPHPAALVTARLPCLATRTPAPATTNAATVEILKVPRAIAARAAGVEKRLAGQAEIDAYGRLAHRAGEAH